jgi:hypothetical protein
MRGLDALLSMVDNRIGRTDRGTDRPDRTDRTVLYLP